MASVPRIRAGLRGEPGPAPELRVDGGYLQSRPSSGGVWSNVVALSEIRGPAGPPGPSVRFLGEVATVGALPAVGNTVNDAYTVTADGDCYVWDGAAWVNVGPFQGPQGDPGDPGPSVELQRTATHVQWRVAGSGSSWTNIIALSILKGDPGADGILHGDGAPASELGADDDTYFDRTGFAFYQKTAGAWDLITQLAPIDPDTGDIPDSLVPSELLNRLQAVEQAVAEGGTGGTTVGGLLTPAWAFGKGSAGDQTLVDDTAGEWFPLHRPTILSAVSLQMDAPGASDALVTVEHRPFGDTTVVDLYAGVTPPTIPTGETTLESATLPPTTALTPGHVRVRMQAVPDGPSGSPTTVTKIGEAAYDSDDSTLPSHTLVEPASGASGDLVVAAMSLQSPTPNPGSAWTARRSQLSNETTVRNRLAVYSAPWATDLNMVFPLTPSGSASNSPMSALAVLLRGADLANPIVESDSNTIGNVTTGGGSIATPSKAAAVGESDLTLYFATWWMGSGITGHKVTAAVLSTLSGAGITTLVNETTIRDSATNVGLWVGVGAGFAADDPIAAQTITVGDGVGGTNAVAMNSGYITFRGADGTTGPVRLLAFLELMAQASS